jgi:hypothetical protein
MRLPGGHPSAAPQPVARGPRRKPRPGCRADIRRGADRDGADLGAGLTDVGADGASVRLTAQAAPGELVEVVLVAADGRRAVTRAAEVRWCRPLGGGLFVAGRAFDRPFGLTDLADLV